MDEKKISGPDVKFNNAEDILEGYYQVKLYDYSASYDDVLWAGYLWIKAHPEYEVEDIIIGSDEGTWITLYCRKK